jgi:hypothetical protein
MFFDQVNMLNVAVSRAKDSFLVIGDMGIFHRRADTPAGKLGKNLLRKSFADTRRINELTDIGWQRAYHIEDASYVVEKPEKFVGVLRKAFESARKRVCIAGMVADFGAVTSEAAGDSLVSMVQKASSIDIQIYVDETAVEDAKANSQRHPGRALEALADAGASIRTVDAMMCRCVIRDDDVFVVGSFDWLSELHSDALEPRRTAVIHTGEDAEVFIRRALRNLERGRM